jgi:hypothetical protein
MERTFRRIKRLLLIIGLVLLLVVPVSGVVSAALHWQGFCTPGPGVVLIECSWMEYAFQEMFWALFIFIPYLFVVVVVLLGMTLIQFIAALRGRRERRRSGG